MKIRSRPAKVLANDRPVLWRLAYLDVARTEGRKFLSTDQYSHVQGLFDELAAEVNPRRSETLDIRPIDQFFELRDKGGILKRINLRVYFHVIDDSRILLVLGAYKKEDDGQTPEYVKARIRNRMRYAIRVMNEQTT